MLKRALTFTFVAYFASWLLWFAATRYVSGNSRVLIATLYMLGPCIGGYVAASAFDRAKLGSMMGLRFVPDKWWSVAWVAAGFLTLLAAAISTYLPGVDMLTVQQATENVMLSAGQAPDPILASQMPSLPVLVVLAMIAGIFPNAIAAFGEESGWRGYLWSVLRPLGFWPASLFVGLLWGLWHAPLIVSGHNYGTGYFGFPWTGVLMMTAFCIALSPFMGLLSDRTGSCLPASIFHGTINALSGISILLLSGADIWTMGIIGFPGIGLLVIFSIAIALALRNNSRNRSVPDLNP